MYRPHWKPRARSRRTGAILIVVLALLALFAVVGLSFIYYADAEADAARQYRDAQSVSGTNGVAPPNGVLTATAFIDYLIFDVPDTGANLLNVMRGHSLARAMYGWCGLPGGNVLAYNGVGPFDDGSAAAVGLNRYQLVNYSYIPGQPLFDPEWTGSSTAAQANLPLTPLSARAGSRTYIGKNAPYTYPDANNFYLASIDPRTGEVLVPSFYRPWMNSAGLAPSSSIWTSKPGRYMFLRPRPQENSGFPYVPQNADKTYTGDVQNLWGNFPYPSGQQKNDSFWMDIGMAPITWNNKTIKPLVAPLVVELDSRININAHGNVYNAGKHASSMGYGPWEVNLGKVLTANANALVKDRYGNGGQARPEDVSVTGRLYNANVGAMPQYAPGENWPIGTATSFTPPAPTSLTGLPTFTGYDNNTTAALHHPSLYNPMEWPPVPVTLPLTATSSATTYFNTDMRYLTGAYAAKPETYSLMHVINVAPSLQGNTPAAGFSRTDAAHPLRMMATTMSTTTDAPMLPPQNLSYAKSTFIKNNAAANGPDNSHPYPGGGTTMGQPVFPIGSQSVGTPSTTDTSDVDNVKKVWANRMAALGGIDLNRPLADYRNDNTKSLAPSNLLKTGNLGPNVLQAWADRHNLARDIFARLIVATGAPAIVDPATGNVTIPKSVTPSTNTSINPQYEALRYLAQLAVNIVDYIDTDDISTTFVWNTNTYTNANPPVLSTLTPLTAIATAANLTTQFAAIFNTSKGGGLGPVRNQVVFGTEKPRLLLNEAYSEIVNDPTDSLVAATNTTARTRPPLNVRFWVELINPTTALTGTGPLGNGSVNILYDSSDGVPAGAYSPYQIWINSNHLSSQATTIATNLRHPVNVRGDLDITSTTTPTTVPDVQIELQNGWKVVSTNQMLSGSGAPQKQVTPNKGTYLPGDTSIVILAPKASSTPADGASVAWDPVTNGQSLGSNNVLYNDTALPATTPVKTAMGYQLPKSTGFSDAAVPNLPMEKDLYGKAATGPEGTPGTTVTANPGSVMDKLSRNTIVLRRLANPYLPENSPDNSAAYNAALPPNCYVTIDYMDFVPTFDAIYKAADTAGGPKQGRQDKNGNNGNGYDSFTAPTAGSDYQRASVGKAQPLAALVNMNTPVNAVQPVAKHSNTANFKPYPNQFLVFQNPNPNSGSAPANTFGRHNGTTMTQPGTGLPTNTAETIAMPFDWLVHMDRPLANPLELLHVSCRKPHELTQLFMIPGQQNANNPGHTANWILPFDSTKPISATNPTTGLYRAFELLRVKPWDYNTPLGGKLNGRVAVNMVDDPRMFSAVLDPQTGNQFKAADVTKMWNSLIPSRTPKSRMAPEPAGGTVKSEIPGQTKKEGLPTGDAPFWSLGAPQTSAASGVTGLPDTLLRSPTSTTAALPPMTWLPATGTPNRPYPYQQTEAARKMYNNVTPVSNCFAVWVTVGFFEVTGSTTDANVGPIYQLGKEAYNTVPGDLRQQYFTTIDRTNLALSPTMTATSSTQWSRPGYTELTGNALVGSKTITVAALTGPSGTCLWTDGVAVPLSSGITLFIGNGPDPLASNNPLGWATSRERVTITGTPTFNAGTGIATLTLAKKTQFYHPAGTLVTTAIPGNPGPQGSSSTFPAVSNPLVRIK